MLNTPIFDITHKAGVSQTYQPGAVRNAPSASGAVHGDVSSSFDSVSISREAGTDCRQKDAVSRISYEIRTATTTGRIQELRQAVASGTYVPDPARIAKCMLFQLEG